MSIYSLTFGKVLVHSRCGKRSAPNWVCSIFRSDPEDPHSGEVTVMLGVGKSLKAGLLVKTWSS